jgi:Tfp pilus assembly protein PilO
VKFIEWVGSDRRKVAAAVFIAAAIAVLLYLNLLLGPQIKWVGSLFKELSVMNSELRNAKMSSDRIAGLKKKLETDGKKVEEYEKRLPSEDEISEFLKSLSAMANDSKVRIVGIVPGSVSADKMDKDKDYKEIPVMMNARSGYYELVNFLAKLENADRLIRVVDIHIKGDRASPKKHDIELSLLTYALKGTS